MTIQEFIDGEREVWAVTKCKKTVCNNRITCPYCKWYATRSVELDEDGDLIVEIE